MKKADTSNFFVTFANVTLRCPHMIVGVGSFYSFVHSSFVTLLFYEIKQLKRQKPVLLLDLSTLQQTPVQHSASIFKNL
jgi:hypothetical protein